MALNESQLMFLLVFGGIFATILGGMLYFAFFYGWNEKRKIFFVRKIGDVYTVFKKRNITKGKIIRSVNIGKNTFTFDIGKPTYRRNNKCFYFVDVDKGQISISEKENPELSAKLLQATLKDEVGKQLVAGLDTNPFMGDIVMLIIGAIIGVLTGWILGNYFPFG